MKLFKINKIFSCPCAEYLSRSSFADHAASASSQVFKKIYFTNLWKQGNTHKHTVDKPHAYTYRG